jgi:hypothetical protein
MTFWLFKIKIVGGFTTSRKGEMVEKEGEYSANTMYTCM